MKEYNEYNYLFPPRPENAIPKDLIHVYEKKGYIAQLKKNGTCTVIFINDGEVIYKTRHNENHKGWTPKSAHMNFFKTLKGWNVIVAELLHNKVSTIKDHLYMFDILVHENKYLIDCTLAERLEILHSLWEHNEQSDGRLMINNNFSIAKTYKINFRDIFNNLGKEDEGIVLKDPTSKLKSCSRATANNSWQVKCRITHKNYSF
jgi:hypothetical protein